MEEQGLVSELLEMVKQLQARNDELVSLLLKATGISFQDNGVAQRISEFTPNVIQRRNSWRNTRNSMERKFRGMAGKITEEELNAGEVGETIRFDASSGTRESEGSDAHVGREGNGGEDTSVETPGVF